jgi:hypothetical protein
MVFDPLHCDEYRDHRLVADDETLSNAQIVPEIIDVSGFIDRCCHPLPLRLSRTGLTLCVGQPLGKDRDLPLNAVHLGPEERGVEISSRRLR